MDRRPLFAQQRSQRLLGEVFREGRRGGPFNVNSLWTATTGPINFPTCEGEGPGHIENSNFDCNNGRSWQVSLGFKSFHPGGANFVFGDGSTHFLSETINYLTYQELGDRWDNQPVGPY